MSKHDAHIHGEIGDDGSHPGSPNYQEPAFDMSDAAANVASSRDDLPVLVQDVAEAEGLLDWIAFNVEIPERHRQSFRLLGRHAHELNVALGKEYDVLNGRDA